MNPTQAVQHEIERFLRSTEPEVLCITGAWGVGKTYTWQMALDRVCAARAIGLTRYSYVSLFGVGSLEALKLSIFENLEFLLPQGKTGFEWMLSGGNTLLKHSKKIVSVAGAIPKIGDALAKTQPLLFTTIRNQIICIDDLERRSGITVKDVFGLISYLREQRGCKIVLLLNQMKLDEDPESKKAFADYFEKVIDTRLIFAPTATEAVAIAIDGKDALSKLIAEYAIKLRIANIRVLKKIERLIHMIAPIVQSLDPVVLKQVVHSVTMFGWCKFDSGANRPSLEYLKRGAFERYVNGKERTEEPDKEEQRWDTITAEYEFGDLDDFDQVLLRFVDSNILDEDELLKYAKESEERYKRTSQAGSFENSWRLFRDSFADNEDEVCKALFDGLKGNFDVVSRANLDEAISILRRLGVPQMAEDLIDYAVENGSQAFWLPDDPFGRTLRDPRLKSVLAEKHEAAKPKLDFEKDLVEAAENMNPEKLAQLAQVPASDYLALFESRSGDQLRRVVLSALTYRRISNASDDMRAIVERAEEALRTIGSKSRLNALRVEKYGIPIQQDTASDDGARRKMAEPVEGKTALP
jgi:hypothetical protein